MIFFYAEDEYYYSEIGTEEILKKYDGIVELISLPSKEEIVSIIRKADTTKAFIAPYLPEKVDSSFEKTSLFELIDLPNRHGVLTTGQHKLGIPEEIALRNKLGLDFHRSTFTLSDYGGAGVLVEEARKLIIKERYGFAVKGYMLAGIPGTGKSFFAKCLAGETNRLLVELNLSYLMEQPNTIFLLNMIFTFFTSNSGRYILWIDEIEKMMVGEKSIQVLGVLLTRISELNSDGGSNIFIIATANNISLIAKNNPEFLRNGRFDMLVFMLPPREEDANRIFQLYVNKVNKEFESNKLAMVCACALLGQMESENSRAYLIQKKFLENFSLQQNDDLGSYTEDMLQNSHDENNAMSKKMLKMIMNEILTKENPKGAMLSASREHVFTFDSSSFIVQAMSEYRNSATTGRFIYTPAEIEFIISDMYFTHYFGAFSEDEPREKEVAYARLVEKYKPLQVTLSQSLDAMKGLASSFITI